jgi:hypothetical protein
MTYKKRLKAWVYRSFDKFLEGNKALHASLDWLEAV